MSVVSEQLFSIWVSSVVSIWLARLVRKISRKEKMLIGAAGSVIQYGSYRIAMHGMGGAFVLMLLMVIFLMPESAYHRKGALNIDTGDKVIVTDKLSEASIEKSGVQEVKTSTTSIPSTEPPKSWTQELLPWSGYFDHVSFWRTLLRPFVVIASPVVMWATLLFTTCISWLVLISITLSQIFAAPPYNFSVSSVGATNVSSFVASLIGTLAAGPIIDGVVKMMSKRNRGIFGKADLNVVGDQANLLQSLSSGCQS